VAAAVLLTLARATCTGKQVRAMNHLETWLKYNIRTIFKEKEVHAE
jgi:hypothetical protein